MAPLQVVLFLTVSLLATSSSGHPVIKDGGSFPETPIPLATPAPVVVAVPAMTTAEPFAGPGRPGSQIQACTSTMSITFSRLPCRAAGVPATVYEYAETTSAQRLVNCAGCINVAVENFPKDDGCPAAAATVTSTMLDATTTAYETACSPTTAYADLLQPREEMEVAQQLGEGDVDVAISLPGMALGIGVSLQQQQPACPTLIVVPGGENGGTTTQFGSVVTVTKYVDCMGCQLIVSTRVGGLGPIVRPGVTMSAPVGTETSYICTA